MKLFDLLKENKEFMVYAVLAFVFFGVICFGIGRTANIGDIGNAALNEKAAELESIATEISAQQNVLNEINEYKTQKEAKQAEREAKRAQAELERARDKKASNLEDKERKAQDKEKEAQEKRRQAEEARRRQPQGCCG